jgi:hypothetical protein
MLSLSFIVAGGYNLPITVNDDCSNRHILARLGSLSERVRHDALVCHTFTLCASTLPTTL